MARQLTLELATPCGHGGKRAGAGRKAKGAKAGVRHGARPFLSARHPVHVVLRLVPEVGRLRTRRAYQAFRWALARVMARGDFRVVHISIQATHVHLICEADDRLALANGVRALSIAAARWMNDDLGRKGRVFSERYHATAIKNPTQTRSALAYVLNNWKKHGKDRRAAGQIDPFSSAIAFPGWAGHRGWFALRRDQELLPVSRPTTWLLTEGWKRGGKAIGFDEVPGARA